MVALSRSQGLTSEENKRNSHVCSWLREDQGKSRLSMTFPHVLSMVRWRLLLWPWPQFPLLALRPHLSRLRRFVGCPGCGTQAQNGVESWNFLRFLSVSPLNVLAKQSTFTSNNACVDNNVNTSLVFFHTNSCTTCNVSRSSPPGAPIDFRQEATIGLRRGDPFTTWRKSLGDFDIVWLPHWHNKTKMKRRLMRYPTAKKTPTRTGPTETHYPSCCWLALVCFSLDVDLMPYRVYSASWKQKCISVLPGHSQNGRAAPWHGARCRTSLKESNWIVLQGWIVTCISSGRRGQCQPVYVGPVCAPGTSIIPSLFPSVS